MNGKKIGNGLRLMLLLERYINNNPYEDCLSCPYAEQVRKLKSGETPVLDTDAGKLLECLDQLIENADVYPGPCRELDTPLDNFMLNLLKIRLSLDRCVCAQN